MLDGARRVPDVLAASPLCVSGQVAWVGGWEGCWCRLLAGRPQGGFGPQSRNRMENLLSLDERLGKLRSNVYSGWRRKQRPRKPAPASARSQQRSRVCWWSHSRNQPLGRAAGPYGLSSHVGPASCGPVAPLTNQIPGAECVSRPDLWALSWTGQVQISYVWLDVGRQGAVFDSNNGF